MHTLGRGVVLQCLNILETAGHGRGGGAGNGPQLLRSVLGRVLVVSHWPVEFWVLAIYPALG